MRIYELCLIIHNDTTDEQQDQMLQSITDIIGQQSGSVLKTEKWGRKNFKFVIKKQSKGHYCFLVFEAAVTALKEIERSIMYNESILRYTFIRLEKFVQPPAEPVITETPVEAKAETPVEAKAETPVEAKVETPVEAKAETPVEAKAEIPVEVKAETDTDTESAVKEQEAATQDTATTQE